MSFLTHKTYFPQASTDLVLQLQPLLAELLEHNPLYEKYQPQDAEVTFFHKEQPCQIVQTHLEFDTTLSFMEKCTRKNRNEQVIKRSMPRDHKPDPYVNYGAKIVMM
jgi:hypothetical protein